MSQLLNRLSSTLFSSKSERSLTPWGMGGGGEQQQQQGGRRAHTFTNFFRPGSSTTATTTKTHAPPRTSTTSNNGGPASTPRSLLKQRHNNTMGKIDLVTREVKALESAMREKDYCAVLLKVMTDEQASKTLQLASHLVALRQVQDVDERLEIMDELTETYLIPSGDSFVEDVPVHLAVLMEGNIDRVLRFLLDSLVKLPEVLATLEPESFDDSFEVSLGEGADGGDDFSIMDECEALADIIRTPELKRTLLSELMSSPLGAGLLVKIRFVAAIDQYEACEDRRERRDLERMIGKIFMTKGGMFTIDTVRHGTKLDLARQMVLRELAVNAEIQAIVQTMF